MTTATSEAFYIHRTLYDEKRTYTEAELLATSQYIVVLAEPGSGKTRLLDSLAAQLHTKKISANTFRYLTTANNQALVLDAFDEVSKIGTSVITEILVKARNTGAGRVILSSRSSEWDSACTHRFEELFGKDPITARLTAFNVLEQQKLFEHYLPNEDFFHFRNEVGRFDLDPLLQNPKFLELFADAYIESERHFTDKRSIFEKAIEHLAKEVNPTISQKGTTPLAKKVGVANEVFAKLLLSGSEGVSSTESSSTRPYPYLASLVDSSSSVDCILETRLFKPADHTDQHQPVHKIVSEYCAAEYLTIRIINSTDALNLPQCLAIIAPNSTVRDELRGMLGWMAALGNEPIQKAAIRVDPYAVLANGDPSQLLPASKRLLIQKLKEVAEEDPLFRRSDRWRTFSTTGFFTPDVVEAIRPLISGTDEQGHLRGLILELLVGSPAVALLKPELQQLMLSPEQSYYIRNLASDCLLATQNHNHTTDISTLIEEGSETSLTLAANIIQGVDVERLEISQLLDYFRACKNLYPKPNQHEHIIGNRYHIKKTISKLDLPNIEQLLNGLVPDLACTCQKDRYRCECKIGLSRIIGSLLDRYFDLTSNTAHNPVQIWQWVKELDFHGNNRTGESTSVRELHKNDELRQSIIRLAFKHETNFDQITKIKSDHFSWRSHSGLQFKEQDFHFIIDLAFYSDNTALWSRFMALHIYHQDKEKYGYNALRNHMRMQAKQKPAFMKIWVKRNRSAKEFEHQDWVRNLHYRRKSKRREKEQAEIHSANIRYVKENRALVESGKHWSCLNRFAKLVLIHPDRIKVEFDDTTLVKNALINCFDFIEPYTPTLLELAALRCASEYQYVENILYAACLETFKATGTLENIKPHILATTRANMHISYDAVTPEERSALKAEIDRLIFPTTKQAENFLRAYLEPQLSTLGCKNIQVSWLRHDETFKTLQKMLPIEWLKRFPNISLYTLDELFELATEFGNRKELGKLIELRCTEYMSECSGETDDNELEQLRRFWLVRAFYFLPEMPEKYWDWLKANKNVVLVLKEPSDRMKRSASFYWPSLSAQKAEAILNAFIERWPKVNLPTIWDIHSSDEEKAYHFLSETIWNLGKDTPENSLPVLDRLLSDFRFNDFRQSLLSLKATASRIKALQDFEAPSPQQIIELLDKNEIATVEGLRELLLQELQNYQADLNGSETTSKDIFYEKGERLGEVEATLRIADQMRLRLEGKGITVTPEHQLKDANRCDFTCSKMIGHKRRLLVTEVKGQWHSALYTAASKQLYERYAIHPDAEHQGIYLVLWFGKDEKIAGKKNTKIKNTDALKESIENAMPNELKNFIDVFVLDLSRSAH